MGELALVCGSSGALGSAVVEALATRGDRVIAVDRGREAPAGAVRHETVDLASADEVGELWQRLAATGETPRWVVNAVGGFRAGALADADAGELALLERLNLDTAWWTCREAARALAPGGAIVNVGARTARTGGAGSTAYAVTKAAVVRLTEVLALELAPREVRVNAVLPSLIDTPSNRAVMPAAALEHAVAPAALAAVIAFLVSDAAGAVTGAIVPVYGFA